MIAPLSNTVPRTWNDLVHLDHFRLLMAEGNIPASNEPYEEYGVQVAPDTRLIKDIIVRLKEHADLLRTTKHMSKKQAMDEAFLSTDMGRLYGKVIRVKDMDYSVIEQKISNCEKTVFVDTVELFQSYVKNAFPLRSTKANKFYTMSLDTFKGRESWIAASTYGNPLVIARLKWIVHSGLFEMWRGIMEYGNRVKKLSLKLQAEFEPQKLVSNLSTIFIIFSSLLVLDFAVFVGELLTGFIRKLL
jgi:hypothetical protein